MNNMLEIIKKKGSDELNSEKGIVTFLNPYSYLLLRKNKKLLLEFDFIFIDGEWLCKFLRWFKIKNLNRCSFDNSSLAPFVFSKAEDENLTVAVVGSDEQSLNGFVKYLNKEYKNLSIVYQRNGYFYNKKQIEESIDDLVKLNPNILVVGMGAVKQEEYLIKVRNKGWTGLGFTCGGFLHQTANKGHEYYPSWINKSNLRFLYRIWDEPKLIKRYTIDYIRFVLFVSIDRCNFKKNSHD